jgi:hypothetical protein
MPKPWTPLRVAVLLGAGLGVAFCVGSIAHWWKTAAGGPISRGTHGLLHLYRRSAQLGAFGSGFAFTND